MFELVEILFQWVTVHEHNSRPSGGCPVPSSFFQVSTKSPKLLRRCILANVLLLLDLHPPL